MNKTVYKTITISGLLLLTLIGWHLANTKLAPTKIIPSNMNEPNSQSKYITTVIYDSNGKLNYKLVANSINYFSKKQITWLIQPIIATFDQNTEPNWTVKADKAKIEKNKILYLYGHVQLDNLSYSSRFKHATTNNAIIDMVTQDVVSDDQVILYGTGFSSTGMKMYANFRNKTINLTEKVKTFYEP